MDNFKPNIVIDVDGVILNFTLPFSIWWNARNEEKIESNPLSWSFNDDIPRQVLYDGIDDFMATHPILPLCSPDIPKAIKRLRETYTVHIITAAHERWKEDRISNLNMYGIEYDTIQFTNHEPKTKMINTLKPVAIIEDSPMTVKQLSSAKHRCFVPSFWRYTKELTHLENVYMYENWDSILQ